MNTIKKIAIANRGEVAVRILVACKELGVKSVRLHSGADINSRAYRLCDESICIGPRNFGKLSLHRPQHQRHPEFERMPCTRAWFLSKTPTSLKRARS